MELRISKGALEAVNSKTIIELGIGIILKHTACLVYLYRTRSMERTRGKHFFPHIN